MSSYSSRVKGALRGHAGAIKHFMTHLHFLNSQKQGRAWLSRSHYGISSMVNQINSRLWCWRVAVCWPPQMHSWICHFSFHSSIWQTGLNWSLPHSKQSAARGWGRYLPLYAFTTSYKLKQQLPLVSPSASAAAAAAAEMSEKRKRLFVWELALKASGDWAQTWGEAAARWLHTVVAVAHLDMKAATSFSRLWAKRWLRKRSCPWGSRRLSRASIRLLLSRTWKESVISDAPVQTF